MKDLKIMVEGKPLDCVADLTRPGRPQESNVGRIGYLHIIKDGEEKREPIFEVGTFDYEGNFSPIPLYR